MNADKSENAQRIPKNVADAIAKLKSPEMRDTAWKASMCDILLQLLEPPAPEEKPPEVKQPEKVADPVTPAE